MKNFTQFHGIDVSKSILDIIVIDQNGQVLEEQMQIPNNLASIQNWVVSLNKAEVFCVLEATGNYSSKLAYCLNKADISFAQVNPARSKYFMDVLGMHNKTDRIAALSLAKMGLQLDLKPYQMPSKDRQHRAQIQQALQAMQKQRQMLKNQIHALEQLPLVASGAKMAYQQTLATVNEQIEKLEEQLNELKEDEPFRQLKKIICSVVGIGAKTAEAILVATNDLQTFETSAQLACFLGLTPRSHHSGTSVRRKGRISKQGAHYIRKLLYMCTRSAIRYNLACKDLYERMRAKGKPYKVALVAVMHKLVKQLFACVKKQVLFDNHFEQKLNRA